MSGRARGTTTRPSPPSARALVRRAEELLEAGNAFGAYDLLAQDGAAPRKDVRSRQLQALALARLQATDRALEILEGLRAEGHADEETLGLLGRVHKDRGLAAPSPRERRAHLLRALAAYEEAHRLTGGIWSGVNAATISLLVGRSARARRLATKARRDARALLAKTRRASVRYWILATLGEAALLLGRSDEALGWYEQARATHAVATGSLASTRRNLRLVLEATKGMQAWPAFDQALAIPPAALVVGHMVDAPGRPTPRFPASRAPAVKAELAAWIRRTGVGYGFVSAASGTDILFAEALQEAGGEVHILLPYPAEDFVGDSVSPPGDARWLRRFRRVLERATSVAVASRHRFRAGSAIYEYGNAYLEGLARLKAQGWDAEILRLAVWDGREGDGPGGTSGMVARWRRSGLPFERIDPTAPGARPTVSPRERPRPARAESHASRIVTAMFGDAVGFSRLSHEGVARFIRHALGAIAAEARPFRRHVLERGTWGDAILYVLDDPSAAGRLAVRLAARMATEDWGQKGLPPDLNLRIGLHTGPVEFVLDPVTGHRRVFGAHVSHAARIEPITPPGHVYASEAFAAISAAEEATGFRCTYVGVTDWAKKYATLPTYHVTAEPTSPRTPRRSP